MPNNMVQSFVAKGSVKGVLVECHRAIHLIMIESVWLTVLIVKSRVEQPVEKLRRVHDGAIRERQKADDSSSNPAISTSFLDA